MVEQRVAVQDRHSRCPRVLARLLALGGGLVIGWTLMTGTAHAAEAPAETPGPVSHLVDLDHTPVAPLARAATHEVTHGVTHTAYAVEHTARHVVRHTVATTHATVTEIRSEPVTQTAAAVPAAVHAVHPVRTHRAPATATRGAGATHAVGATSRLAPGTSALVLLPAAQRHTDAGTGDEGPSRPVGAQRADSPAGGSSSSGGQPAPTGPSPGAAMVDDPPTPQLLASGEHSADTRPVIPPEPAYPPGCSPD